MTNDERASFIAMIVRNALEDLHVDEPGLTDAVMAKLNPLVRRAIWEALEMLDKPEMHMAALMWTEAMIPDYWEQPSTLPPTEQLG
jgi:hypothetical protein